MALFWLLAGVVGTLAALILLLPWLRTIPRLGPLPAASAPLLITAGVALATEVGLCLWLVRPISFATHRGATAATPPAAPSNDANGSDARWPAMGADAASKGGAAGSMATAVASLEARLAKGGGSTDDWELLAKSYEFLGRPQDAALARAKQLPATALQGGDSGSGASARAEAPAAAAPTLSADSIKLLAEAGAARRDRKLASAAAIYAKLAAKNQMTADSWADYADTAASMQGNKLAGAPASYAERALQLDPRHPKALWLKASADEEQGHWSDAAQDWQRLAAVLDPDSADAKIVAANLQQAQKMSGGPPAAASGGAPSGGSAPSAGSTSSGAGAHVTGEVMLAESLRSKADRDATLFIVAKSVDSPGMPVAVVRSAVGSWPVKFTLDDSQAMMPGRNLSSAGRITVEARVSKSGQAMPASGDLKGSSGIITPSANQPLKIVIDQVVP